MILTAAASDPGGENPNEDHYAVSPAGLVVVDGQTARTDTGCWHGVAWHAATLTRFLHAGLVGDRPLREVAAGAITATAAAHDGCDLTHPGTPSAVLAAARIVAPGHVEWLVLGDVTVVASAGGDVVVHRDLRVDAATAGPRAAAVGLPVGSRERAEALVVMKHAEHVARNTPGGFWCAAADPDAASHAYAGELAGVDRLMLLSDGAARVVDFGLSTWPEVLGLAAGGGVGEVIRQVRGVEAADPELRQWPRTKAADDATVVAVSW